MPLEPYTISFFVELKAKLYKSFLCEEDAYLLELVRYIHLNPLRAEVVKDLKQLNAYPFSGHHVLMGKFDHEWQDTDYVLGMFGKTMSAAIRAYAAFMIKGISAGRRLRSWLVAGCFVQLGGGLL